MQRKPGYPVTNCNIRMPDSVPVSDTAMLEDDDQLKRRQQLINFGHSQWGFNNWSWAVSKQDLDFVDLSNGKYAAGVVAFVSINVKSFDIHRENIGYATSTAPMKGLAIHRARKSAVTNALRETLLSFGGSVATDLMELLETNKQDLNNPTTSVPPEILLPENNQNLTNKITTNDVKNLNKPLVKKDIIENVPPTPVVTNVNSIRSPHPSIINPGVTKSVVPPPPPPVAKAHPIPANLPPAANKPCFPPANQRVPAPHPRPNSNSVQSPLKACAGAAGGGGDAGAGAGGGGGGGSAGEEEAARAERKRRQKMAQEEFQRKLKQKSDTDGDTVEKQEFLKSGFDTLLMDIPTQDIVIEESGNTVHVDRKRKSPEPGSSTATKRRASVVGKLDIIQIEGENEVDRENFRKKV